MGESLPSICESYMTSGYLLSLMSVTTILPVPKLLRLYLILRHALRLEYQDLQFELACEGRPNLWRSFRNYTNLPSRYGQSCKQDSLKFSLTYIIKVREIKILLIKIRKYRQTDALS